MPDPRRILAELGMAAGLLTRLPVGFLDPGRAAPADAVWAYPVIGVVVGAAGAAALWAGRASGLPPLLAALLALAATALLTGALHEDGLSDTADGFGGGATREARLRIMRDSRIGSYGALALVFSVAIRASALTALAPLGLIAVAVASRAVMVGVLASLPPARPDGLGASLGTIPRNRAAIGLGLALAIVLVLLPKRPAVAVLAAAVAAWALVVWRARRLIGGHTGDVCGAAEQIAECAALILLAACSGS